MNQKSSHAKPYLITDENADGRQLSLLASREKVFNEKWLQELLYKHPSILPVDSINSSFAPLIALGREIAGIDDLFISPEGLITIVETKLWRNPEAHRTVVAQILEYARNITSWSFQRLDEVVQNFTRKRYGHPKSIYKIVRSMVRDLDLSEMEFQQRVQDCIDNGRFALLIVGDKIFPGATQLAETIQSAPDMHYSMGFVELRCYRFNKDSTWPLIVIPHFVAKTKEITRAVVKVVYEQEKPEIEVFTPEDEKTSSTGNTTFDEFIASLPSTISAKFKLYITNWQKAGYTVYWGKVGFSLRLEWKGKPATIFDAYPTNAGILGEKRISKYKLPEQPYTDYRNNLMKSPVFSSAIASGIKQVKYVNYKDMSEDDPDLLLSSTDQLAAAITAKKSKL